MAAVTNPVARTALGIALLYFHFKFITVLKAEVSDTTGDEIYTTARIKNIFCLCV